jgi:hypothetical protein
MTDNIDVYYNNKSLSEKEEILDVFFEKTSDMEKKIYKLWDDAEKDDRKLLRNMLSTITLFKTSYYDSRQINDYENDLSMLKMGRYLCTIPYAYLNTALKIKGETE